MGQDNLYIKHILDAITTIEKYLKEKSYEDFLESKLLQDGVIRELEIIGEASKNLSADFKKKTTSTAWKDISGMRDKLAHHYFGVDIEAVWQTAENDLPVLKSTLLKQNS